MQRGGSVRNVGRGGCRACLGNSSWPDVPQRERFHFIVGETAA